MLHAAAGCCVPAVVPAVVPALSERRICWQDLLASHVQNLCSPSADTAEGTQ